MNTPYNSAMRVAVFNTAKLIVPNLLPLHRKSRALP